MRPARRSSLPRPDPCRSRPSRAARPGGTPASDPPEFPLHNPDFELYDNVGRDAEQIAAYHTRSATSGDLRRWARRDAEAFRSRHPLPSRPLPAPDLAPFLTALEAAETPAEFSEVVNQLLDAAEPVLNTVIDFLAAAAQWRGQNRGAVPGSPSLLLRDAASRVSMGLAMAAEADLRMLRAHYDPPPDLTASPERLNPPAQDTPPAPPPSPGPGGPRR